MPVPVPLAMPISRRYETTCVFRTQGKDVQSDPARGGIGRSVLLLNFAHEDLSSEHGTGGPGPPFAMNREPS